MNLLTLPLLNRSCSVNLGNPGFYQRCKDGKKNQCPQCNGKVKPISGIICGNFGHKKILGYRCSSVFHAIYCCKHESNNFPVLGKDDADNSLMDYLEPDDPKRFQEARDGDHMMLTFQCG